MSSGNATLFLASTSCIVCYNEYRKHVMIRGLFEAMRKTAGTQGWGNPFTRFFSGAKHLPAPDKDELSSAMTEVNARRKSHGLPELPFRYRPPYKPLHGGYAENLAEIQKKQTSDNILYSNRKPYSKYGQGTVYFNPNPRKFTDYFFSPKSGGGYYRLNEDVMPSVKQNRMLAERLKDVTTIPTPMRYKKSTPSISYDELMAIQSADPLYPMMAKLHGQDIPEPFLWGINASRQNWQDYLKNFQNGPRYFSLPVRYNQGVQAPMYTFSSSRATPSVGFRRFDKYDAFFSPSRGYIGYDIDNPKYDFWLRFRRTGVFGGVNPSSLRYNRGVTFGTPHHHGATLGHELNHANQAVDSRSRQLVPWLTKYPNIASYPSVGGAPNSNTYRGDERTNNSKLFPGYGYDGHKRLYKFIHNSKRVLNNMNFPNDSYAKDSYETMQSAATFNRSFHALKNAVKSDIRPYVSAGYHPDKLDQLVKFPTFTTADDKGKKAFEERLKFFKDNPEFGKLLGVQGNRFPSAYWGMHQRMLENNARFMELVNMPDTPSPIEGYLSEIADYERAVNALSYLLGRLLDHRVIY